MPLFFLFLIALISCIRDKKLLNVFSRFSVIIFLFQPNIFKTLFDILTCTTLDPAPGKAYITKYLTEECYTMEYFFWIGVLVIPSFMFYAILFPIYTWFYTKNNLGDLNKVRLFISNFGKQNFYW